jgi:hypothetical protein
MTSISIQTEYGKWEYSTEKNLETWTELTTEYINLLRAAGYILDADTQMMVDAMRQECWDSTERKKGRTVVESDEADY